MNFRMVATVVVILLVGYVIGARVPRYAVQLGLA